MTSAYVRWVTTDPRDTPECPTCEGFGCEHGCGRCEYAYVGPDSHRVCRSCLGTGQAPEPPEVEWCEACQRGHAGPCSSLLGVTPPPPELEP